MQFTQLVPDSAIWHRVQRSTGTRGLGLRSSERHAAAAFTASCVNTASLQVQIYPVLSEADVFSEIHLSSAMTSLPRSESVAALVQEGIGISQRSLSRSIDRAEADAELLDRSVPEHTKAHIQLITTGGADSWLHAYPNKDAGTWIDPELYRIALARRMRVPLLDETATCSACGACLDVFMDHALVCSCGGDRTLRHNAIRDAFFEEAQAAGVHCEREN